MPPRRRPHGVARRRAALRGMTFPSRWLKKRECRRSRLVVVGAPAIREHARYCCSITTASDIVRPEYQVANLSLSFNRVLCLE